MGQPQFDFPVRSARAIGRYYLHDEIGAGGMATVHLGWMVDSSRVVAIKRLRGDLARDPEFVAMFRDEARVAMSISHPNVVPALELLQADGDWFLVMEYVRGAALSHLLRGAVARQTPVAPAIAVAIAIGMLRGLHATHIACDEDGTPLNVVHRDVSPQNLIVGIDGTPRLVDFGVAKAKGRLQLTQAGELKGKLPYMAPEQLDEGDVSPSTDVYAASAVLWETLCGQKLFHDDREQSGADATEAEARIDRSRFEARRRRYAGIAAPSSRVAGISEELDRIVPRGLHRLPARRFQSAEEMADALAACGPVASNEEVGAWVRSLEQPALAAKERLVAAVEESSRGLGAPVSAVTRRPFPVMVDETTHRMRTVELEALIDAGAGTLRSASVRRWKRKARRALAVVAALVIGVASGIALAQIGAPSGNPDRLASAEEKAEPLAKRTPRETTTVREEAPAEALEAEADPSAAKVKGAALGTRGRPTHVEDEIPARR